MCEGGVGMRLTFVGDGSGSTLCAKEVVLGLGTLERVVLSFQRAQQAGSFGSLRGCCSSHLISFVAFCNDGECDFLHRIFDRSFVMVETCKSKSLYDVEVL